MYVVCVTVHTKPECVQQFLQATLDNARNTRKEAGNLRFDVLQADDNPCHFLLYEAYKQKEDFTSHQQTGHYLRWKQTVADHMAQPRSAVKTHAVFFGEAEA